MHTHLGMYAKCGELVAQLQFLLLSSVLGDSVRQNIETKLHAGDCYWTGQHGGMLPVQLRSRTWRVTRFLHIWLLI